MLYICIPAFNEAETAGLVLWRIRKVFESYSREYEVIVLDDGSTDATPQTLAPYADVMPLTIIRNETRKGYAAALDTLARAATRATRYPRRDAMIFMQADFTDQPEAIPELVKRFEGGADLVIGEINGSAGVPPVPVRRLRRVARLLVRPFIRLEGVGDPFGTFRLIRVAVVRDLLKERGDVPLLGSEGWAANVELVARAMQFARRVETAQFESRYDLRVRESRVRPLADAMNLLRFSRSWRGRSLTPSPT
jgi:glycosyltransferase involved in cell wall biosynthesis